MKLPETRINAFNSYFEVLQAARNIDKTFKFLKKLKKKTKQSQQRY